MRRVRDYISRNENGVESKESALGKNSSERTVSSWLSFWLCALYFHPSGSDVRSIKLVLIMSNSREEFNILNCLYFFFKN
jgi:hypothetical protein